MDLDLDGKQTRQNHHLFLWFSFSGSFVHIFRFISLKMLSSVANERKLNLSIKWYFFHCFFFYSVMPRWVKSTQWSVDIAINQQEREQKTTVCTRCVLIGYTFNHFSVVWREKKLFFCFELLRKLIWTWTFRFGNDFRCLLNIDPSRARG